MLLQPLLVIRMTKLLSLHGILRYRGWRNVLISRLSCFLGLGLSLLGRYASGLHWDGHAFDLITRCIRDGGGFNGRYFGYIWYNGGIWGCDGAVLVVGWVVFKTLGSSVGLVRSRTVGCW